MYRHRLNGLAKTVSGCFTTFTRGTYNYKRESTSTASCGDCGSDRILAQHSTPHAKLPFQFTTLSQQTLRIRRRACFQLRLPALLFFSSSKDRLFLYRIVVDMSTASTLLFWRNFPH